MQPIAHIRWGVATIDMTLAANLPAIWEKRSPGGLSDEDFVPEEVCIRRWGTVQWDYPSL
ncbi:hypothetical protein CTAM01_04618 [Colletotrichum tamarilloi]|uniref:Uncharacterized protein n=1 Tax=Colletotrichum tamarilloi TaxID=1209934 RepID=A0ABQ9RGM6_9PEZI|nr:uncharacterized protein CTAM01_04618 [Colletotrichum tamarilloi]KAK1503306.1 hypothetical protein CTAM01_04618 [Colletotrichum tamarilloi]